MEDVIKALQNLVDANKAQLRAEHLHDNRLLTEYYLGQISNVESTLMELQAVREEENEQAQVDYEEVEEQVEELEREKEELEEEKRD
ncbi:hypothetical protein QFC24_001145 [Naganishia onofrii]|uniref:Uncharacterized protein n=1 Tax=Naganishia onofrii TaxID=1851511 RepID=A0ACC2XU60_9TREE|nr:hypothetical protein QFC24_001145 [Naganishia onofrii]